MTNFYTADLHLFHEKISEYCGRPFKTTEKMWRAIKRNWNSVIGKDDTIWIAGDITLKKEAHKSLLAKMFEELNGEKHMIIGNHDMMRPIDYEYIGITSIHYPACWLSNGWVIGHDPSISTALPKDTIYLCGHQHGNLFNSIRGKNGVLVIDVGLDVREPLYTPISEEQIKNIIQNGESKLLNCDWIKDK